MEAWERRKVVAAMGGECVAATHVIERREERGERAEREERGAWELVGYGSVDGLPVLTGKLLESVTREEGLEVVAELERIAAAEGARFVVMPVTEDCRFKDEMRGMGYKEGAMVRLWVKPVRERGERGESER